MYMCKIYILKKYIDICMHKYIHTKIHAHIHPCINIYILHIYIFKNIQM